MAEFTRLKIVPLSGMGGPYAIKDEDGPPGYVAQWIKDEKLAYMFAAAPEMYRVLKTLVNDDFLEHYPRISIEMAREALSKAEGKEKTGI